MILYLILITTLWLRNYLGSCRRVDHGATSSSMIHVLSEAGYFSTFSLGTVSFSEGVSMGLAALDAASSRMA